MVILNNEAIDLVGFGEVRRALQLEADVIKRIDARGGNLSIRVSFRANYGRLLAEVGRFDGAIATLQETIAQARATRNVFWELRASFFLARALVRAGRLVEGSAALDRSESAYRHDELMNKGYLQDVAAVRAEVWLRDNRAAEAKRKIEELLSEMGYPGNTAILPRLISTLPLAAEIALAAGDAERADALAAAGVDLATRAARDATQSADVGRARLTLGNVRLAQGQRRDAAEAFAAALPGLANGLGADHPLAIEARQLFGSSTSTASTTERLNRCRNQNSSVAHSFERAAAPRARFVSAEVPKTGLPWCGSERDVYPSAMHASATAYAPRASRDRSSGRIAALPASPPCGSAAH